MNKITGEFCGVSKYRITNTANVPSNTMLVTTPTPSRRTAPTIHGFSGSCRSFNALSNDIARSYNTHVGVTRKFLLLQGQSRFILAPMNPGPPHPNRLAQEKSPYL